MNEQEALMFLEAENAYAKRINRMSVAALRAELAGDMRDRGQVTIAGGPRSKDELIGALCRMHYPPLRRNEAIHVRGHGETVWPDCEFCTGPKPCHNCGATADQRCFEWCGAAELRLQPAGVTA